MNIKFLDKVVDQIISETRIIGGKIHTPLPTSTSSSFFYLSFTLAYIPFSKHCKEVYSLKNEQEIEYVWTKYKEGVTTLIKDKTELSYG